MFLEKLFLQYLIHPQLVKLKMSFQDESHFFLVLELIEGKNFGKALQQRDYSNEEIVNYLVQINWVLSFIHKKGVVHRDVKFENFIECNGKLTLIDFDSASIFDEEKAAAILPQYQAIQAKFFSLYQKQSPM